MPNRVHRLAAGECLFTLADRYGFPDAKAIYSDPANEALRKKRPNLLVLATGDEVTIPEPEPLEFRRATGQEHLLTLKRPKVMLNLKLQLEDGSPVAGKPFALHLPDQILEGTTTGGGEVKQEIPIAVGEVALEVFMDGDEEGEILAWNIHLGHLDPIEEVSGQRQRLNNLGFFAGEVADAPADDALRYALRAFQAEAGLEETGEADDGTRAKLVEAHGGI